MDEYSYTHMYEHLFNTDIIHKYIFNFELFNNYNYTKKHIE